MKCNAASDLPTWWIVMSIGAIKRATIHNLPLSFGGLFSGQCHRHDLVSFLLKPLVSMLPPRFSPSPRLGIMQLTEFF